MHIVGSVRFGGTLAFVLLSCSVGVASTVCPSERAKPLPPTDLLGESMTSMPSNLSIASLIFQTAWVAFITFLIWYGLVQHYSANRLAALTFVTPLFGVAAGYLILDEPLTPQFLTAVAMVMVGTALPRVPDARTALRRARSRTPSRQPKSRSRRVHNRGAARIWCRISLKNVEPRMG